MQRTRRQKMENKKNTEQLDNTDQSVNNAVEGASEASQQGGASEKPKPMSSMQKVQYMYSLTEIAEDENVKNAIKSKKNGHLVYDLFTNAVSKKIDEIMTGDSTKKQEENTDQLQNISRQLQMITQNLGDITSNSQLLQILHQLNEKLGGTQPQQQPQQQPSGRRFNQQYAEPSESQDNLSSNGSGMVTNFIT